MARPNISFEPLTSLFEEEPGNLSDLFKDAALTTLKHTELIGVPDVELQINFNPEDGSDILVKRIDPEKALGYSVFEGEEDYFNRLSAELYSPTEAEIEEALDG